MDSESWSGDRQTLHWGQWRWAALMYVLGVAVCAWMSFGLPYVAGVPHEWLANQDVWTTTHAAQYAWNGGPGYVYHANPWFAALPGFIYLYAPVVALAGHLGLVTGYPWDLAKPSRWLVSGPFFFLCAATAVLGVDYLADTIHVPTRRRRFITFAIAVFLVGPTPGIAGHPEDLLALALTCFSVALLLRGRPIGAALTLSIAILLQTWAGLALPVLVAASPPGLRVRTAIRAGLAPALLGLLLLAIDFHQAATDMLRQPMPNTGQHLPWWGLASHFYISTVYGKQEMVSGSTTRSLAVVVAFVAAWAVRNRRDPYAVVFAVGVAMFARTFFEVEYWPYYWGPAIVLLLLLGAIKTDGNPKRFVVLCVASFLLYASSGGSYVAGLVPPALEMAVVVATGALCFGCLAPPGKISGMARSIAGSLVSRYPKSVAAMQGR